MFLTDEDYEVYIYVFEYIFQNIIFWTCAITIGVVCRKVKEMLVFLLVFIPLRKTSGGVHAGTVDVCLLFSVPDKFGQSEKRVGGNRRIA